MLMHDRWHAGRDHGGGTAAENKRRQRCKSAVTGGERQLTTTVVAIVAARQMLVWVSMPAGSKPTCNASKLCKAVVTRSRSLPACAAAWTIAARRPRWHTLRSPMVCAASTVDLLSCSRRPSLFWRRHYLFSRQRRQRSSRRGNKPIGLPNRCGLSVLSAAVAAAVVGIEGGAKLVESDCQLQLNYGLRSVARGWPPSARPLHLSPVLDSARRLQLWPRARRTEEVCSRSG